MIHLQRYCDDAAVWSAYELYFLCAGIVEQDREAAARARGVDDIDIYIMGRRSVERIIQHGRRILEALRK